MTQDIRALIAAPGRTPHIPAPFDQLDSPALIHLNDFIPTLEKKRGLPLGKIAVVGGSQSAVEILLHLAVIVNGLREQLARQAPRPLEARAA